MFIWINSSFADELNVSIYAGQSYDTVKSKFLTEGWMVVTKDDYEQSLDGEHPEIVCGSGLMAICSVGFQSDSRLVTFIVEKSGKQIIVLGEY